VSEVSTATALAERVGPELTPAEERGELILAERVVEKIVTQAVAEVDQAVGASRGRLRVGRTRAAPRARVAARLDGDIVSVRVVMSVLWPASVPAVTQRVRERIARQLLELASLRLAEVEIDVADLPTGYGTARRRVR